jgi:alcohol dehydrogenase (cytochrome c)
MNISRRSFCSVAMTGMAPTLLSSCSQKDPMWVSNEMLLDAENQTENWLHHAHDYASTRYSTLDQINQNNVKNLVPDWTFRYHQEAVKGKQECSSIVVNGVIYLTGAANRIYAIDGRTGEEIWRRVEFLPPDSSGCCGPMNRGPAYFEDKVYWTTFDNRLFCLDSMTGNTVWWKKITPHSGGSSSTGSPIIVKGTVEVGIAGRGDPDSRGFIDAYDCNTGERIWRHYSVPLPGEPGSETWGGHRPQGGMPWGQPGSYDPEFNLVYWSVDDPIPGYNGSCRPGDNLYTNCILALNPDTGERVWYFQIVPHAVWDHDTITENVLIDIEIEGRMRKALYHVNRNGFFYVFDRETGEYILGKQYITKQTWCDGLDENGRPRINEDAVPKPGMEPVLVYPDIGGGKNWPASAYSPRTGYAYFYCSEGAGLYGPPQVTYKNGRAIWQSGWMVAHPPETKWSRFIAVDVATGETAWEIIPQTGIGAGVMTTAGGLVFVGDGGGKFLALHEETGEVLWSFNTGGGIKSPPVTFTIDGKQHIGVPSGNNSFNCFSLFEG